MREIEVRELPYLPLGHQGENKAQRIVWRGLAEQIMATGYPDGMDEELLVKAPHDELYVLYLKAKIDAENGEYSRYADSSQLYNEAYGNFARYWGRTHEPAQGYERGYEIV